MNIIKKSSESQARITSISIGDKTRTTPFVLNYTKQGAVPHLVAKNNVDVNIAAEQFIDLIQHTSHNNRDDKPLDWNRCFRDYLGYQENALLVLSPTDLNRIVKEKEWVKGTVKGIGMSSNGSVQLSVIPTMFSTLINLANPDLCILGDPQLAIYNPIHNFQNLESQPLILSKNQERKAKNRWIEWILSLITNQKVSYPVWACVPGASDVFIKENAIEMTTQLDSLVSGYGIYLPTVSYQSFNNQDLNVLKENDKFSTMRDTFTRNLKSFTSNIPESKPRALFAIQSFEDVVIAIREGIDVIENSWLEPLTLQGKALFVSFKTPLKLSKIGETKDDESVVIYHKHSMLFDMSKKKPQQENTELISKTNSVWQKDLRPLALNCQCWTCQKPHTRAYIHHLFCVNDMLSYVMLYEHNLHQLNSFVQEIRESIETDQFDTFARAFLASSTSNKL
ncbi:hypothetical protein HDV02_002261 [Globomyces sp. JEL0801]|nr:hypothetical protein HDV02_002261 [Globomyces sp. JEL0801]